MVCGFCLLFSIYLLYCIILISKFDVDLFYTNYLKYVLFPGTYFCLSMVLITVSTVLSTIVANMFFRGVMINRAPRWLRTVSYMYKLITSAGFRKKRALGYSSCEALPNSPPSRLEEDASVLNQFQ